MFEMQRNDQEHPVLIGQTGPLNGKRWTIEDILVVGRDASCDIMVPERQVSRRHARFYVEGDTIILEDLGSRNGTHLNGQPVSGTVRLQDGDLVHIALAQQFLFLSSDATVPLDMQSPTEEVATVKEQLALRIDARSRRVWIRGEEISPPLSVAQFAMIDLLYRRNGRVVSRQELMEEIWGEENAFEVSNQALDALVRRLRDRLADIDPQNNYIVTVRGHGLRLDNPDVSEELNL